MYTKQMQRDRGNFLFRVVHRSTSLITRKNIYIRSPKNAMNLAAVRLGLKKMADVLVWCVGQSTWGYGQTHGGLGGSCVAFTFFLSWYTKFKVSSWATARIKE